MNNQLQDRWQAHIRLAEEHRVQPHSERCHWWHRLPCNCGTENPPSRGYLYRRERIAA